MRGAFTGADRDRKGAFVEATGGTLFLDELGELPLPAQAKLLRVLEAQTVQPVGADRPVSVDTRVVAATHRDLARMVAAKEFRFDLFYRLAVVHVALPPLRERLEDLPHLIGTFYQRRGAAPGPIDGENLDRMRRYGKQDAVDLLVVGAGAGGVTLAQRLARAGWRVVILEKGPFWDPDRDWVSDEKGSGHLYWTDTRVIGGNDPIEMHGV